MLLLWQSQGHPVAGAIAFAFTLGVAVFAVYAWQAPRDRKAIADWLRRAPGWSAKACGRLLSPRAWWSAVSGHPRAAALAAVVAALVVAGPLVAYRVSPAVRLAVAASRLSERAEGPTFWGPIIREGRPAIPFLIGQFTAGESAEDRAADRRVDSVLRLTVAWLHSRRPFTTTPLPPQPVGRERWTQWWKENEPRIPDLGRADDLYDAWRDIYNYTSPSGP